MYLSVQPVNLHLWQNWVVSEMAGRLQKSSVWNYFKHDQEKNKCVCQVKVREDDTEVMCGKELNGVFA